MTNQQKYVELMARMNQLGIRVDDLSAQRIEVRKEMEVIAKSFPKKFFYRVDTQVLFRTNATMTIELKEFTK